MRTRTRTRTRTSGRLSLACMATSLIIGLLAAPAGQARSLEGVSLEGATGEDFFTFFHLSEKTKEERDNLITHYFEPKRCDNILVSVDADKSGKILQMGLVLGREFIENPKTNIFARDIVKSFIDAATPLKDAKETEGIVNEIFFRGTALTPTDAKNVKYKGKEMPKDTKLLKVGDGDLKAGDVAIMLTGAVPQLPAQASDAYRAFEGSLETCEQALPNSKLVMINHKLSSGWFLEVRVDVNGVKKEPKFAVVYPPVPVKSDKSEGDRKEPEAAGAGPGTVSESKSAAVDPEKTESNSAQSGGGQQANGETKVESTPGSGDAAGEMEKTSPP